MTHDHPLTIQLAFQNADEQLPDPVAVSSVARQLTTALREQGYPIQPVATGQRVEICLRLSLEWDKPWWITKNLPWRS